MNVDDVDDAGDRLVPWERKPTVAMAMAANCVLAFAAIRWQEPVVSWGGDVKDYFNQIYLHPSQRHLSTILWRDPTSGDMTHILELSLGFGQRLSSNFANRLTFALVAVFATRVDALEAPLFDAETDPSRRDWIAARRRLSDVTGRNECRLFSILAYTDDFKVQVVGLVRALRLMIVWYDIFQPANGNPRQTRRGHVGAVARPARVLYARFRGDPAGQAIACAIFKTLTRLALGGAVAGTLPLHGGRIFLAVALRAQDYGTGMIKAFVRWRSAASAALYGRVMQNDHAAAIGAAMVAAITPTLIATSRREDILDNNDAVLRAQSALSGSAAPARHAASPSGPPSRTAAAADDGSGSSDDASGWHFATSVEGNVHDIEDWHETSMCFVAASRSRLILRLRWSR